MRWKNYLDYQQNHIDLRLAPLRPRLPSNAKRAKWVTVFFALNFATIGTLIAYFELYGSSPDREQYNIFFDTLRLTGLSEISYIRFEAGFTAIAFNLVSSVWGLSNAGVYSVFVFFCLLTKGWVIAKHSKSAPIFFLIAAFYVARFFPLHELTQLRVACATSCLALTFHFRQEQKTIKSILFGLLSVTFHNSAFFAMAAIFLPNMSRNAMILGAAVFLIANYFLSATIIDFTLNSVQSLRYMQDKDLSEKLVNLLNPSLVIDYALLPLFMVYWHDQTEIMKRISLLQIIGLLMLFGNQTIAVVAYRFEELFASFLIFYFADGLALPNFRYYCIGLIFVTILWFVYLFHIQDVRPFFT